MLADAAAHPVGTKIFTSQWFFSVRQRRRAVLPPPLSMHRPSPHIVRADDARTLETASTASATLPARRSASAPPRMLASIDFRDSPTSTGQAAAAQLLAAGAQAADCAPWSCRSRSPDQSRYGSRRTPPPCKLARARSRNALTSLTTST